MNWNEMQSKPSKKRLFEQNKSLVGIPNPKRVKDKKEAGKKDWKSLKKEMKAAFKTKTNEIKTAIEKILND